MKFKVLSRQAFEGFIPTEPFIAISITDPNSEIVRPENPPQAILSLEFHDADKRVKQEECKNCNGTGMSDYPHINGGYCYACTDKMDIILFNEKDADSILEFVATYASDIDSIVIHCEAGKSRSVGVASALSLIYNREDQYYFDHYLPNMLVYRKIINMAVKKGFFK